MMRIGRASRLCVFALAASAFGLSAASHSNKPGTAQDRYHRAQQMEAALEVRPGGTRTEADYLKVIKAYQDVKQLSSAPLLAAPSLIAIARLYEEMGNLFDTRYFQSAVDAYRQLLRDYPHSLAAPEALYSLAELERGPLGDPVKSTESLESLVKLYPSSDQADKARLELARPEKQLQLQETASSRPAATNATPVQLKRVSTNASPLSTGTAAGGEEGSHPTLVRRVATQQMRGATRIVVYLNGPVKFRSARIAHPDRVYFDLSRAYLIHPRGTRLSIGSPFVNSVEMAQNEPHVVRVVLDIHPGDGYSASLLRDPYRLAIDVSKLSSESNEAANTSEKSDEKANADVAANTSENNRDEELPAKGNLTPARPTHAGATSLTRALGLKIDRIVIDPGHGGFDTGSIGPDGLEEKTVCLEIALRLGRLIHERLPGTKVIYTRDSDVFVPLEQRTEIANEKQADLFISIHANSSTDPAARGVEVYYLNFTTSPEAIAVAARENALAQEPVHRLQDLLKEISLNDKIEESQELALDVDHTLVKQLRLAHVTTEDRGVKKAPFVVLIGAHMPSVLVEVSFLSNPTDEELLEEPRYRQRIALGIFDGVQHYLSSLNSLSFKEATTEPASNR